MTHFTEQIEAYLTGGLTPAERAEFEAHIATCGECAQALSAARAVDASMRELFLNDQPSADFEDRMIAAIQMPRPWLSRPIVHPAVRRAAVGLAASLMIGAIGYLGSVASRDGTKSAFANPARKASRSFPMSPAAAPVTELANRVQKQTGQIADTNRHWYTTWNDANSASRNDLSWQLQQQPTQYGYFGENSGNSQLSWGRNLGEQDAGQQVARGRGYKAAKDGITVESAPQLKQELDQQAVVGGQGQPGLTQSSEATKGVDARNKDGGVEVKRNSADMNNSYALPTVDANDFGVIANTPAGGGGAGGISSGGGMGGGRGGTALRGMATVDAPAGAPLRGDSVEKEYFSVITNGAANEPAQGAMLGRDVGLKEGVKSQVALGNVTTSWPKPGNEPKQDEKKSLDDLKENLAKSTGNGRAEEGKLTEATEKPAITTPPPTGREPSAPPTAATGINPPPKNPETPPQHVQAVAKPKIIRSGEMEFEVEGFDSAVNTLTKIVVEEGGYVSTTSSDKLPNGKVKGSVVLRVAPEHLDVLVLKLRGIGDLKTQRIGAQDISKQYTDLESGLRAAQAMYERLLDIIKSGKGQVKDLLEAEKQLGVWREKVEQLQGEINYYNNLVAYSTLTLTLYERDIRTPAQANETETVTMTLITDKVDEAYNKAKDAIDQAKGRIVASDLKQHDAGEFLGTITAQVPPDKADAVIGLIRQISGQLAHFDRQRSQTTSNGNAPVDPRSADLVKVKREDVTITVTLYNLANIKPRRWTNMTIAAANVDEAYRTLIDQTKTDGGRIVDSRIEHPKPDMNTGVITLDIPAEKADALLAAAKGLGETLQVSTTENANTQDVTESKRGFQVTIYNLANIAPRRWTSLTLVANNVDESYRALIDAVKKAGGRVATSKIEHPKPEETLGTLTLDVPSDKADALLATMRGMGEALQISNVDNADTQNTTDSKRGYTVSIRSLSTFASREQQQVQMASLNVPEAFNSLLNLLRGKSSRIVTSHLDEQDRTNAIGSLEFEVGRDVLTAIEQEMNKDGQVVTRLVDRSTDTENTVDSKVHVKLTIGSSEQLPPRQSTDMNVQVSDVQKAMDDLQAAALQAGGRQIDNPGSSQTENGQVLATVRLDVPLDHLQSLIDSADSMGKRKSRQTSIDTRAPEGKLARARLTVTFATPEALAGADEGMWAGIRHGLSTSLVWLGHILTYLIVGLFVVLPCALIAWGFWRGVKWSRRNRKPVTVPAT